MPSLSVFRRGTSLAASILLWAGCFAQISPAFAAGGPTLERVLGYPFIPEIAASKNGHQFAWVENVRGVRNIWLASPADAAPRQLTHYTQDDGQEITQLTFSPDGSNLVYVRGGDHDADWPVKGNLAPDPDNNPSEPKVTIWSVALANTTSNPVQVAQGDSPAISSGGQLAFVKDGQIWTVGVPGAAASGGQGHRLFFDRGKDSAPVWSPDGTRLAFVSGRGDHSFVGVYRSAQEPLLYLAPSTSFDTQPVWSPDGGSIAFLRQPSQGNMPENFLVQQPHPFALWTADSASGEGQQVWSSPDTLEGSLPEVGATEPLFWMSGNKLVFLGEMDGWPHLYAVAATGGHARLLTPGNFMVEDVVPSPDHRELIYSANAGTTAGDNDRRHLFRVAADGSAPKELTSGDTLEWSPVALAAGKVAYITAGARQPPAVAVLQRAGDAHVLDTGGAKNYPAQSLIVPKLVHFKSPDGLMIEGQLFRSGAATTDQPGIVFVHGGPPRQMLLGWHPMDYYSNSYAVNQYLAAHGFTVLSVNYRLGVGYGRAFQHPVHAGPAGASEYQDVLAGARYLQNVRGVDASRIGIWGGSYGGYLTGLALARNSDVFKAGVDFHGISNWVPVLAKGGGLPDHWYQASPQWKQAIATAFAASPDADIKKWRSPVLLIQGDDDRNVPFDQTVELSYRLREQHTPVEDLVFPNEIHGFLRWADWLRADRATVRFFEQRFAVSPAKENSQQH